MKLPVATQVKQEGDGRPPSPIRLEHHFGCLEAQAKLSLELAMQSGLCVRSCNQPEIAGHAVDRIDILRWVGRFRLIENITGVNPELESLRFGDSELLVQVRVKSPPARRLQNSLPQSSSRSRERILQYGQTRFRV